MEIKQNAKEALVVIGIHGSKEKLRILEKDDVGAKSALEYVVTLGGWRKLDQELAVNDLILAGISKQLKVKRLAMNFV